MSLKILFYGTPAVAVPFLELLSNREQVVAAVCQPDKPAGRALNVDAVPIKKKALELGIPVLQPEKSSGIAAAIGGLAPDLAVAVAYGKILKADALKVPKQGTLNVHFSLLPKYRGAAPLQWSLVNGERKTGVTLFWLDEGMDTGPIFLQKETEVGPDEDAPALMKRLTTLGVEALGEVIDEIKAGRLVRKPQTGDYSLAPLIEKDDARVDLIRPGAEIHNLVRGMRIWPKAWLQLKGQRIQVLKTGLSDETGAGEPGTIIRVDRSGTILLQCGGSSRLMFLEVQPEGKKPVSAADFINGLRMNAGDVLPIDQCR
jgi:methionyl-tRNA formyltransferase